MDITISSSPPSGWDNLVADCPWGTFYHGTDNIQIIQDITAANVQYLSCLANERLLGGIAVAESRGSLGTVVNCLPFYGSYGDAVIASQQEAEPEECIYRSLLDYCREIDALSLNVITSPFAGPNHHEKTSRLLSPTYLEKRCCQAVTLPGYKGETRDKYKDSIMLSLQGRARTAYRKTSRMGFTLLRGTSTAEAAEFASIHKSNIGSKGGIYKTGDFFTKILDMSQKERQNAELIIAKDNDRIIAGIVLCYFKNMVEYHTTCLRDDYRSANPLNFIIIEKMIDAGMQGYNLWNFGGTWKSQKGVYKFKQSFGAQDYYYYYYTTIFRDVDKLKNMASSDIIRQYPYFYVVPFTELMA